MGLFDKFKRSKSNGKEENENKQINLNEINDDTELFEIVNNNPSSKIRLEAAGKIKDEKTLEKIVCGNYEWILRKKALENIFNSNIISSILERTNEDYLKKQIITTKEIDDKTLEEIGLNDRDSSVRIVAIEKINNNDILYEIIKKEYKIKNIDTSEISLKSIENITDTNILKAIAKNESCKHLSTRAILKITDNDFLKDIAKTHSNEAVRIAAINKISDEETLKDIGKKDPNIRVRKAALDKIHDKDFLVKNIS